MGLQYYSTLGYSYEYTDTTHIIVEQIPSFMALCMALQYARASSARNAVPPSVHAPHIVKIGMYQPWESDEKQIFTLS